MCPETGFRTHVTIIIVILYDVADYKKKNSVVRMLFLIKINITSDFA